MSQNILEYYKENFGKSDKILLINTSDINGGAAVACIRLAKLLIKEGYNVKLLVKDKYSNYDWVYSTNNNFVNKIKNKLNFLLERFWIFLANGLTKKNLFRISTANFGINLNNHPLVEEAQIIHFHWINQGMMNIKDIAKISQKKDKKILWTMHDFWPVSAICHYPNDCKKFENNCKDCSFQAKRKIIDLCKIVKKQKQKINFENITLIGCSDWITDLAKKSNIIKNYNIISKENVLDNKEFYPKDKQECRKRLKIESNKKLILFACQNINDERKGFKYFFRAVEMLKDLDFEIVLMGKNNENLNLNKKTYNLGYVSDTEKITDIYNACDIFAIPSLEDNFPNTILEAKACNLYVVAFEVGGIPQMIDSKEVGYIAKVKDSEDFANGLKEKLKKM